MAAVAVTRQTITDFQRQILVAKFNDGMRGCNKSTLRLRESAASETGLSLKSVSVNVSRSSFANDAFTCLTVARSLIFMQL